MTPRLSRLCTLLLPLALGACATHENVKPPQALAAREVCIVFNPTLLNDGFLPAYEKALQAKGFTTRRLPEGAGPDACPVVSTYAATWGWNWVMFLRHAQLRIYSDQKLTGEATYSSGRYSPKNYIATEPKIIEMVDQLFPNGAVVAAPPPAGEAPR